MLVGLGLVVAFYLLGTHGANQYRLDLGEIEYLRPQYRRFLLYYLVFGLLIVLLFTMGLARAAVTPTGERLRRLWLAFDDSRFLLYATALGFMVPATIRTVVLQGAPVTDDESAYRFSADLLLSGRLYVDSPVLKLFYDRSFVVNDGRYYTQYFMGWPALMAPFRLLGLEGYANSVYLAATVPGMYYVGSSLTGRAWGRLGVLLLLLSPLVTIASATALSHTTCLCALTWTAAAVIRIDRDPRAPWWVHFVVGLGFSIAFFVRPQSTIGIGLPLLLWWARGLQAAPDRATMVRGGVAFLVPSVLLGAAFLAVNWAQNGSPLDVAYQAYQRYVAINDYRFTHFKPAVDGKISNIDVGAPGPAVARNGEALTRLAFAALGHPVLLFTGLAAIRVRASRPWWTMLALHGALNFFLSDSGVDVVGPVHHTELVLPFIVLVTMAGRKLGRTAVRIGRGGRAPLSRMLVAAPAAVVVACMLTSVLCYLPVRLRNIARLADNILIPFRDAEAAELDNAVVFAPRPFAPPCGIEPANHHVFWWPLNSPDFDDPILWVNHVSHEDDLLLMTQYPGRTPYLMMMTDDCEMDFLPLAELPLGSVPPELKGGLAAQPDLREILADLEARGRKP